MKKIFTILLSLSSFFSFAQGPVIEGTYLPVRGTAVKEIWDKTSVITVPDTGQNMVWDYSAQFINPTDTFKIQSFHPNATPYFAPFPDATHASYLRAPFNDLTDSLYSYFIIDRDGLFMVGGRSMKQAPTTGDYAFNDTTVTINPKELYIPDSAKYGMHLINSSRYETYGRGIGMPIKIKGGKVKDMYGVGSGTLKMPNGTVFTDVLLTKVIITTNDSVFDVTGTNLLFVNPSVTRIEYSFLRNNTFASSALMYLSVNPSNTAVYFGWYTLPVDIGSISGLVYDSIVEIPSNLVLNGEALLYRENSNFSKNDILAKSSVINGVYRFDSIPYGQYRISIRPEAPGNAYLTALTTYWGDISIGNEAPTINTSTDSTWNTPIHLLYHTDSVGTGNILGYLLLNEEIRSGKPIPGIDIIVQKKPGGIVMREVKTDASGAFALNNLADGAYDLYVDIPGLDMTGTYNVTISGGTVLNCLDFLSGTDSIHPVCPNSTVGIQQKFKTNNLMQAFPNPYAANTTIKVNIIEKNDILLEVYNIMGEKIQTLDKGQKQPGNYSYNFSASNLNYSSGIYIVRLTIGDKTQVLKLIEQ